MGEKTSAHRFARTFFLCCCLPSFQLDVRVGLVTYHTIKCNKPQTPLCRQTIHVNEKNEILLQMPAMHKLDVDPLFLLFIYFYFIRFLVGQKWGLH